MVSISTGDITIVSYLTRYYVAEGVRIYNQDTWRLMTGGDGKQLVEMYIKDVVRHFVQYTETTNAHGIT